jgi:hypothetical protein
MKPFLLGFLLSLISALAGSQARADVIAATVGTSSVEVLAASPRHRLEIANESSTASIACAFGTLAALNAAGSFTIGPLASHLWGTFPVNSSAVNCIASTAGTPVTVDAQ